MKKITLALCTFLFVSFAQAASQSPVGTWRTIDDDTGKVKSLVSVWLDGKELKGKIIELIDPEEETPICDECKGKFKNVPIVGLTFVWGLEEDDGEWEGGKILDPGNGKIYKAKLKTIENGTKLEVRGFIGFALIGRTQIWERAD